MSSHAGVPSCQRLRSARERAGYGGAQEVADAFGWPDYPLDEGGERVLTAIRAKLYAHAFHVDPEWLLSGTGEPGGGAENAGGSASGGHEPADEFADELAGRISRLSGAQRVALVEFLRAMQDG